MQVDYRNMHPPEGDQIKTTICGLRQKYVPLLTDGAFANQLAIVRGHGKEDFMTVVLDTNPRALVFYSRFAIPVVSPDYKEEPEDFWTFVLETGQKIRETGKIPVLTLGDAEWLLDSMIEFGLERLKEVFAVNQDYELQWKLQDKYLQCQKAAEAGLLMPQTWLGNEAFFKSPPDLPYPVLVKERRGKKVFRDTGKQAFEAQSWEQLLQIKEKLGVETEVIVQEKITDNGSENMYSIGAFCRKGVPDALFTSRRLRATREYGSTALSVSEPCPEGIEAATKYLKHLQYHGSCELEFIFDSKREQLLLLELNSRLYKTQSLATHCGINLNYLALLDAMNKPAPPLPVQMYGPKWWLAWGDLAAGIRKMTKNEMTFRDFMEPLSFDFVNGIDDLDDPLPGFVNLFDGKY
jgi:predicted ATP-grasp superfamily ATP-dependent carboligase